MTQNRSLPATLLAFTLLVGAFALMTSLLTASPAQAVQDTTPVTQVVQADPGPGGSTADLPGDRVRYLVPNATDLTPDQQRAVLAAADRVCEGKAAGVRKADMIREVSRTQGLSDAEARQFVNRALRLC
jgi:hypothetical protein